MIQIMPESHNMPLLCTENGLAN